jgi:hypothetical protein
MLVETRVAGKKVRLLDRWSILPPPTGGGDWDGGVTLRALITRVVLGEVQAFGERQRMRRLVSVLSQRAIDDGAAAGKVDPGGHPTSAPPDADAAVGAALQGFEDGLYLVILDGVEQTELDRQIHPTAESQLVFLRLAFLAGA